MRKLHVLFLLYLFFLLCLFLPSPTLAQLKVGQYEDEAPLRTWNSFGVRTASSLGMGETLFASGSDCSVALSNPALLVYLPGATLTFNAALNTASFFKYSIVNTGVLTSEKPLFGRFYTFDFAGFSFRLGNWAFSASWGEVERYARPKTRSEYSYQGTLRYFLELIQRGSLKNVNLSLSRRLFGTVAFGLGLNYSYGNLNKDITESWVDDNITIFDYKSHEFKGLYVNGGVSIDLTEKFRVAAVFRTPFIKKSTSHSLLRYYSPDADTEITIEAFSEDTFRQPLILGAGVRYAFSENLIIASDVTFFNWSRYRVDYFEEPLQRDFKDVVKVAAGIEYWNTYRIFKQNVRAPTRIGFVFDPQPMKEPGSSYFYLSLGTGIHWGGFFLDASSLVGKEWGSGDSLAALRLAVSLGYEH